MLITGHASEKNLNVVYRNCQDHTSGVKVPQLELI